MRKLKLQMQMTLDGKVSTGPHDAQKWVTPALDDIRADVLALLDTSDTILLGRKLAVDYIPFWQDTFAQPAHPMHDMAQRIAAAKKVVFSQTLTHAPWDNTELASGPLVTEVQALKNQPGQDLIVYGGSSFVSALIKAELIDTFHFFLNPVAIGQGESVFQQLSAFRRFELLHSKTFASGIVLLSYQATRSEP